ncbi:hypothetical protein JKP88DRAFT_285345 [Tribonema minus]|uniref:Uncharacterized protein n=1 Tax=Tribonema minus TaxID=303371 RepID=A0A836CPX8_9STRA|nr:hypothetical protein JKP88DRAFT_285345 [Tribonema minus]
MHLILESEEMNTISALRHAGIADDTIIVPNPDPRVVEEIKMLAPAVKVYPQTLYTDATLAQIARKMVKGEKEQLRNPDILHYHIVIGKFAPLEHYKCIAEELPDDSWTTLTFAAVMLLDPEVQFVCSKVTSFTPEAVDVIRQRVHSGVLTDLAEGLMKHSKVPMTDDVVRALHAFDIGRTVDDFFVQFKNMWEEEPYIKALLHSPRQQVQLPV